MALESNAHQLESNLHQPESNVHHQVTLTEARIALVTYAEQRQSLGSDKNDVYELSFYGSEELENHYAKSCVATPHEDVSMSRMSEPCLSLSRWDKAVKNNGSGEDLDNRQKGGLKFKNTTISKHTIMRVKKTHKKRVNLRSGPTISMAYLKTQVSET
jgi:hypothetical protein